MHPTDLGAIVARSARLNLPPDSRRIAVALSGGVDSMVLLHVLAGLRTDTGIELVALHVNHGLSAHAAQWEEFCAMRCEAIDVPFSSATVAVDRSHPSGLEGHARALRHAALREMAARAVAPVLALAHHADDQAETVILQLLRGGAARGIAAMSESRAVADGEGVVLWRPLLHVTRDAISSHARRHALTWIEDESNADCALRRNFLRTRIMPTLAEAFPDYRQGLARAAAFAAENARLLEALARIDARDCVRDDGIAVERLRELGADRSASLLRHVLRERRVPLPTADALHEFVRQALSAGPSEHPRLRLSPDCRLAVDGGIVRWLAPAPREPFCATWNGEARLRFGHGDLEFVRTTGEGFRASHIAPDGLLVQPRPRGARLRIRDGSPRRAVSDLMREAGIPVALREGWPVLMHAGDIVAIPGIVVGVDWRCPPGAPGWVVRWQPRKPLPA